ncbi:armadillo repeat-containing protein 2 isoform C [Alligator mississippiensis]|uniref:Armadillo repeat-containing protein 2 isoform C n=1 Tax=Alligator mississippiensis TaxID=8496 RepID=A0A151MJQ7_ALLMI|nr:armadillo repeat-containing protein 2 isoform C [Alligator mississippiensis]
MRQLGPAHARLVRVKTPGSQSTRQPGGGGVPRSSPARSGATRRDVEELALDHAQSRPAAHSVWQKTSAEIINEARNALRTLRTQRPLTPQECQRKLFGSTSSRTPDERPPSAFSLHASSFESSESRPISGARLSPLDHKPKLFSSPTKDQHSSIPFPKPPVDPLEVRKVGSARARLFRTTSWGSLPDENKERLNSEDPAMTDDLSKRSNENCLAELSTHSHIKDDGILLMYKEYSVSEKQDFLKGSAAELPLQLSGSNQIKKYGRAASCPSNTDWGKSGNQEGLKDDSKVNESEEEENYWNVKILPILCELESEDNIEKLCLACTSLYQALEEGHMLGKRFKRRTVLLKTLYKLVDIGSDPLCLKLAKIILAMKVSGKNMLSVCKLAFKICRNEKNDFLIQNDKLLVLLNKHQKKQDLVVRIVFILGAALAANHYIVALLIMVLEYKSIDDCEELVINATATLNSLSYYQVRNSAVQDKKLHIAELLLKLLMSSNMDGILEAVRVFGNLSQYHEISDFLVKRKIYKFMIALLDAKHQDVCFSACGVLLNLTVDKNKRAILKEEGGIRKLIDCLRDFGPTDWQLACLICKTLWNYSENITNAVSCFGEEDINTLLMLLDSLLDEEVALDYNFDKDLRDYHKMYWETEFKPVAEKLLSRLQRQLCFFQPITVTSF